MKPKERLGAIALFVIGALIAAVLCSSAVPDILKPLVIACLIILALGVAIMSYSEPSA